MSTATNTTGSNRSFSAYPAHAPGLSPCPERQLHAGIWRYDAGKTGQMFSATERYATGTRNAVALAVNEADGTLYATLHGRDHLGVH